MTKRRKRTVAPQDPGSLNAAWRRYRAATVAPNPDFQEIRASVKGLVFHPWVAGLLALLACAVLIGATLFLL